MAREAEEDLRRLEAYLSHARVVGPPAPLPRLAPVPAHQPSPETSHIDKPAPAFSGKLVEKDYADAAKRIGAGVDPLIVHALAKVESGGHSGFGALGLPKIAYEGHVFADLTHHKYDRTHPLLSYSFVVKAGPEWRTNNENQETAWKTLKEAAALDETAALESCSWGMFQVMGKNYATCKYAKVQDFVAAMKAGEKGQLEAFTNFCLGTPRLPQALADKNYQHIARAYNGKHFGDYDKRIEKAYYQLGGK